ncbi:MAG: DUF4190 domain-containing protein [Verrucomicrobia bacterium]|nr:DUF4190 domain-containing protein [Verrucomicrobiota bacterium]MBI3867194.1 DUF4190 domain-containing protein [Verrucomicrobiota bacterium]
MFIVQRPDRSESEPLDLEALRHGLQAGTFSETTPVRRADSSQWMPLQSLLAAPASGSPPPLASPPSSPPSSPAVSGAARVSKLAVASLICGLLTLPTCGLGGIAAVVCGVAGLVAISKSKKTLKGEPYAVAGIILAGLCLVLVLPALLLPALAKAKARAQTISCINNMKQVALGLRIYANDHKEILPDNLKAISQELTIPRLLICPGDGRPISEQAQQDWSVLRPEDISYEYVTPGLDLTKSDAQTVILRCPVHGSEAHADGSVTMGQMRAGRRR